MQDNQLTDQLQEQRELTELLLVDLAKARRKRKAGEAERETATADARAELTKVDAPFAHPLEILEIEEESALNLAIEAVTEYDAARKIQLMDGIETPHPARPEGVSIKWLETPTVADVETLASDFVKKAPDMKKIKAALAGGLDVGGVVVERKASITVTGSTATGWTE